MSSDDDELKAFLAARRRALIEMDVEWARSRMGAGAAEEILLIALHKARYACTDIPAGYRRASGRWLRKRGYAQSTREPLLPDGELPE